MRTLVVAILGLIVGFFVGEALAAFIGITTNQLSEGVPPDPALWILRSLPFIFAIVGAIAASVLDIRRGSR